MNRNTLNAGRHCITQNLGKISSLLLAVTLGVVLNASAQNRGMLQKELNGAAADKVIPGASSVREAKQSSFPSFVRMSTESKVDPHAFAGWLKSVKRVPDAVDFKLMKVDKTNMGGEYYRYSQTYQNIPIAKGAYVVHAKDNRMVAFNGHVYDVNQSFSAKPVLSEAQALKMAMQHIGAKQYKWENEFWQNDLRKRTKDPKASYLPKGELCWSVNPDNTLRLAYRFDIHSSNPDKIQRIYVDANQGEKIQILPLESNCSSATVNTVFNGNRTIFTDKFTATNWRLRNDCQAAIFHVRDWNSATLAASPIEIQNNTNTWTTNNERFGGTVLWLTERAYAYWLNVHGRNSYDNGGGDVDGYINAKFDCSPPPGCVSDFNASMSFTGGTMKVGAGSGFADGYGTVDIIGHEFAHAVTGATSSLDYINESGALNESFSDIFGEMNELYVFGSNDWLLGDERSSGYIRNMSNPNDKGDPDTYLGTNWYTGTGDNGGVHTNSGVQNFWFYLLVNGGSGTNDNSDAYTVSGVGTAVASFIAYVTLISLTDNSDYGDARDAAIQAASFYYGACSNVTKQVTNAWYAVGVGDPFFDATAVVTSNYNGRHVSCNNACDATISVNVTSGVSPIYSWSPGGQTTQTVTNRCPGVYTVTVTNLLGLGCSIMRSVTVNNTPLLVTSPAATTNYNGYNISCNGATDGAAAANASGGTGPYTYSWSPGGQTTATATNLGAGNYTVTVTDANGCVKVGNVTLTEPPLLTTTAAPTTNYNGYNVRCHGGSDGAAEAYPVGGVAPYSYSWSPSGQTTKAATNLSATTYTVTVTDANGCVAVAQTTLTEPPQLTIDAGPNQTRYYGYPDSNCATLTATGVGGGVPPYTLQWSTSASTTSINVCPSTTTVYYVTVTDANNCTWTDSVKVCIIDVRCGANLSKVEMCHYTNDPLNPRQTICVSLSSAKNHFISNHGDELAACGTDKSCNFNAIQAKTASGYGGATGSYSTSSTLVSSSQKSYLVAFPNPLSEATTVRFKLPGDAHANLKLYDISGKEVMQLFDGDVKGGMDKDVLFDASRIAAGMYFVRLLTGVGESYELKLIVTD